MRFFRPLSLALVVLPVLSFPLYAKADSVVFNLGQSQVPTTFNAGTGIGQAVFADQTLTIDSFGFDLKQTGGGNVNYFIYDATTSSIVLAPTAVAVSSGSKAFAFATGLSVTLDADNLYYFGVYGNNSISVNMDPTSFSGNGLSLPASGPTSADFTGDTLAKTLAGTLNVEGFSDQDASLRILSNNPPAAAPEPNSLVLMGTGILAAAGAVRKRLAR